MCGILIFKEKNLTNKTKKTLKSTLDGLKNRGPDELKIVQSNNILVGFTRLSINDIDNGSQPFKSLCGKYLIVFNGEIGRIFQIRANMSTNLTPEAEQPISRHTGGILYDLAGHMIDQIVYLLGRPNTTKSFLRQDISQQKQFSDNTLCVLEFQHAIATVDINSRTINHIKSRRFEVYGDKGSLILEPFEPAEYLRMSFKSNDKYLGINEEYPHKLIPLKDKPRYVENFESFIKTIKGEQKSDRTLEHELLVQETLLRVVGG